MSALDVYWGLFPGWTKNKFTGKRCGPTALSPVIEKLSTLSEVWGQFPSWRVVKQLKCRSPEEPVDCMLSCHLCWRHLRHLEKKKGCCWDSGSHISISACFRHNKIYLPSTEGPDLRALQIHSWQIHQTILVPRIIVECHYEFRCELLAAYIFFQDIPISVL